MKSREPGETRPSEEVLLDRSEAGTGELRQALGRAPLLGRGLWAPSESGLEEEQRFRISLLCRWGGV